MTNLQGKGISNFSRMMKNRSFMTSFDAKGSRLTKINLCSLSQRWSVKEEKLCCVCIVGSPPYYLFWNFKSLLDCLCRLILSKAVMSVWKSSPKNAPYLSIGEMLCFSMITQGHTQLESHRKNIGFWLICSTLSTIFSRLCTKWFLYFLLSKKFCE